MGMLFVDLMTFHFLRKTYKPHDAKNFFPIGINGEYHYYFFLSLDIHG